jgi:hypothetical protein
MIVLVLFLVGWMVLRAPLERSRAGIRYWRAHYCSALSELGSTVLALAGMIPILIFLPERIWFVSIDPAHPGSLGLVSLSAIAGTVTVYLYAVWLEYCRSAQNKQPSLAQFLK